MNEIPIDLYFFLSESCDLNPRAVGTNNKINTDYLLSILDRDANEVKINKIWLCIPGWFLKEKGFQNFISNLQEMKNIFGIHTILIQCNAESIPKHIDSQVFKSVDLFLNVCDHPSCGAKSPSKIISNYLNCVRVFKSIHFVGPSPINCVIGLRNEIRRKCLINPFLYFIMSDGEVRNCPFNFYGPLGNITTDSIKRILMEDMQTRINIPEDIPYGNEIENICARCLTRKL